MPGNTDRIIITGTSGGGALGVAIAASGNSPDYYPYLYAIGAAGITYNAQNNTYSSTIDDDVFGTVLYCAITDLDHMDGAYEWMYGNTRKVLGTYILNNVVTPYTAGHFDASDWYAANYAAYFNGLGLKDEHGNLLTTGNFLDHIKAIVEKEVAETYVEVGPTQMLADINSGTYKDSSWFSIDANGKATVDLDKYLQFVAKNTNLKGIPASDNYATPLPNPEPTHNESSLAGTTAQIYSNFDEWAWDHNALPGDGVGLDDTGLTWQQFILTDAGKAVVKQMKMSNPIPYLLSNTEGNSAPYWYFRHGMKDRDTSFDVPVSLYYAALNATDVINVNFELAWLKPHSGDYDVPEAYEWVAEAVDNANYFDTVEALIGTRVTGGFSLPTGDQTNVITYSSSNPSVFNVVDGQAVVTRPPASDASVTLTMRVVSDKLASNGYNYGRIDVTRAFTFTVLEKNKVDYSAVATQANCEALQAYVAGLTDVRFSKPVTNVTATWKTSSGGSFCQVTGWMWPEIKFQVTLPAIWNERYVMNGGGGWDGSLSVPASPNTEGYASSSANGGYMSANWTSSCGSFGLGETYFSQYYNTDPDPTKWYPKAGSGGYYAYPNASAYVGKGNPDACQKVVDFGYRHLYETPVIAKKIVKRYYGIDPKRSYYSGGSCGGKEGQISAQRFPELYDGFFIGYPLGGHLAVTFRGTWDTLKGAGLAKADPACVQQPCPTIYAKYKAALHYKTVYNKCDAVDGLVDGLIDDPRQCKFDALLDLPACDGDEEAAEAAGDFSSPKAYTCFTLAQRNALKEIYAGPHDSMGNPWYPGQPLSAEYVTKSGSVGFSSAIADGMAPCMFANIAMDPPQGPYFNIGKFNWDQDPMLMQQTLCHACIGNNCQAHSIHTTLDGITISPNPAFLLGGFEPIYRKGVKIVQTHGWSDSLVTALAASAGLYETTLKAMGVSQTKSFWKLYLVPGAGHGGGGLSAWPTNTAAFDAMVDWVERGIEPGALIASRAANVDANYPNARTRPSCPYPEVARWNGSAANGGIDNAANFSCAPPVEVKIEPDPISLTGTSTFTASIALPEGYTVNDWNIHNVYCGKAPMVQGTIVGNTYVAKFKTQDLTGVSPGPAVTLGVTLNFLHNGVEALTQGYGTVRIIN